MNIAIIPARGGSKGIHKKNLTQLCNRPMICYTIEAALDSRLIDEVYISTDDQEIASVVSRYTKNIIMRPDELAKDDTPTYPVIMHALDEITTEKDVDKVIVLQVTSPLRNSNHVDEAINSLTNDWTSIVSVCEAEHTPFKMFTLDDGSLVDFVSEKWRGTPRQILPEVFRENGAIYVSWLRTLVNGSLIGNKPGAYLMEARYSLDIDNHYDLLFAETLLSTGKYEK